MRRRRTLRWTAALGLIAVLCGLPYAIGKLPAGGSSINAKGLLARVQASASVGYSGYAESSGTLALPVTTGQFSSVADLFGSTTQLRVWWRTPRDWRVDQTTVSGEQDLHAAGEDLWSWNYESNTAELDRGALASGAHLPRPDDLVPASLARRLLSQAQPDEVRRIASKRIAGREAAGLRYTPNAAQSTISRVDVWALPGSGLPVSVAVYGKGDSLALVSTTMLDLSTSEPSTATTAFSPPPGAKVSGGNAPDLLSLADRLQTVPTPRTLGGLPRDSISPTASAVTAYGSGATVLVAIPVFGRTGGQIRDQLTKAVGSVKTPQGVTTAIGPVNVLLSDPVSVGVFKSQRGTFQPQISWLLVGTVTTATLTQAGADIASAGR